MLFAESRLSNGATNQWRAPSDSQSKHILGETVQRYQLFGSFNALAVNLSAAIG
jgi:hypothetical protein